MDMLYGACERQRGRHLGGSNLLVIHIHGLLVMIAHAHGPRCVPAHIHVPLAHVHGRH